MNGAATPAPLNGRRHGCTLFVDADDTLWENNVYFEAVVCTYCHLLEARGIPADEARAALLAIERVRTKTHGYGIDNFRSSLRAACRQFLPEDCAAEVANIDACCDGIRSQPMALLPGVEATLEHLASRHRLIVLTKGDPDDQHDKVARSGLAGWFSAVDVVKEKDPVAYAHAIERHAVDPATAWMVGNSPRSDVAPALAVGLGAVFIPHPATWVLELDPLPDGPHERLIVIDRFTDLTEHF
jgi:putative hydrolase of the HAD superfamily